MASRSVHDVANVRSSDARERQRLAGMDLQLGVRERLGADQGQLDLGVGQKEQVLARIVDAAEAAVGGTRLLDAQLGLGEGRPVDALDRERPQPVVAADQVEGRRRRRRRELVTRTAPARSRPSLRRATVPSAVRSRISTAAGASRLRGLRPDRQRLAPAVNDPSAVARLDQRQVGPDLDQEPLVARRQQPARRRPAPSRSDTSAAAIARTNRAASAPRSTEPPAGRSAAEDHGHEQAEDQTPRS